MKTHYETQLSIQGSKARFRVSIYQEAKKKPPLKKGRFRVIDLLGSREKETAEEASFLNHIAFPSYLITRSLIQELEACGESKGRWLEGAEKTTCSLLILIRH